MAEVPDDLWRRCEEYCRNHARHLQSDEPTWWGWEAFLWLTTEDSVLKVHRNSKEFLQELAVYQRLATRGGKPLQGFQIPLLLDYDENRLVLELSFVRPPYVLDFGRATLDGAPADFDPESPEWIAEKQQSYGSRWPEIVRLLDALRHLGIHYVDVHRRNICIEPRRGNGSGASSPRESMN
jgi:hypothetical protein